MNNLEMRLAMIETEIMKATLQKNNIDKYLVTLFEMKKVLTDRIHEENMPCKGCNHA